MNTNRLGKILKNSTWNYQDIGWKNLSKFNKLFNIARKEIKETCKNGFMSFFTKEVPAYDLFGGDEEARCGAMVYDDSYDESYAFLNDKYYSEREIVFQLIEIIEKYEYMYDDFVDDVEENFFLFYKNESTGKDRIFWLGFWGEFFNKHRELIRSINLNENDIP